MQTIDLIHSLESTNSRNAKAELITEAYHAGNREFFYACRLAYDPLITFGVQKVPFIEEGDENDPGTFTFEDFLALAEKLRRRELTGNAAREAILDAACRCHIGMWNDFYRRILRKDLRIGVETKTYNSILGPIAKNDPDAKQFMIPVLTAQLAEDGSGRNAKLLKGKKLIDTKLDGVRLLSILDKESGVVTQLTGRNGSPNDRFTEIRQGLERIIPHLPGSVVLDGEVVAGSFQELMQQISRTTDLDTSTCRLALFDIIPLSDFMAGYCPISQMDRHKMLVELEVSGLLQKETDGRVFVLPKVLVDLDTEEGRQEAARLTEEAIRAGFHEAVMYKDPDAPYEPGRRRPHWLKKKPFIEVSLSIVGFEEGDPDGKYAGTLGALVCRGHDMDVEIETNVGSGLTDELRDQIWRNKEAYLGMIVEIRADALTLEQGASVHSLRFPRFRGFRGTVPGEKL